MARSKRAIKKPTRKPIDDPERSSAVDAIDRAPTSDLLPVGVGERPPMARARRQGSWAGGRAYDLDQQLRRARVYKAKLFGGGARNIQHPTFDIRPGVVDAHSNRATVAGINEHEDRVIWIDGLAALSGRSARIHLAVVVK